MDVIAEFIMRRAGIECPKEATKEEGNAYSKKYHGTVRIAGKIMNRMIFQAIEEAADPIAIRAARRFHPDFREVIYRSVVNNPRLLQLVDTFPLVAFNICLPPENWAEHCREEKIAHQKEAIQLVNQGARLKRIAAAMDTPLPLRRLKPGCVGFHMIPDLLFEDPRFVLSHLPNSTVDARRCLMAIEKAERKNISPGFVRWVVRNAPRFLGGRYETHEFANGTRRRYWLRSRVVTKNLIDDLADFARACKRQEAHVVRPFQESMSLRTVMQLSEEWHDAVKDTDGPQYTFPAPWLPGGIVAGYEFVPLTSSTDLYQERAAMHNCVGTYGEQVMDGDCYIYSVRHGEHRAATLEVVKRDGVVGIGQPRSACNKPASPEIAFAAREWISRMQGSRLDKAA